MAQKHTSVGAKLEERKRASDAALAKRIMLLLVILLAVLFLVTAGSAKIPWWLTIALAVPACVWLVYDIVVMLRKQKQMLEEKLAAEAAEAPAESASDEAASGGKSSDETAESPAGSAEDAPGEQDAGA